MPDTLEQQLRARLEGKPKPPWAQKHVIQRQPQPKAGKKRSVSSRAGRKKSVPMTEEEQAAICSFVLDGGSLSKASQLFGRSMQTVSKALATQNVTVMHPTPEASRSAVADYTAQRRLILINKMFDRIETIVDEDQPDSRDMKDLAIATGIMIDKRRLEDGEATSRHETGAIGEAKTRLQDKLEGIIRARAISSEVTYEAVDTDIDMPGELVELEKEASYEEEEDVLQRDSAWGIVGE